MKYRRNTDQPHFKPPPRPHHVHGPHRLIPRPAALTARCPCGCLVLVNAHCVTHFAEVPAYWTADTDWCPACRCRIRVRLETDNHSLDGTPNYACVTLVERETMPGVSGEIVHRRSR